MGQDVLVLIFVVFWKGMNKIPWCIVYCGPELGIASDIGLDVLMSEIFYLRL